MRCPQLRTTPRLRAALAGDPALDLFRLELVEEVLGGKTVGVYQEHRLCGMEVVVPSLRVSTVAPDDSPGTTLRSRPSVAEKYGKTEIGSLSWWAENQDCLEVHPFSVGVLRLEIQVAQAGID